MARAAWAVVAVGALVVSYVACQNTWRGMRQDTRENAALAKQKAQEAHLDEKARAAGDEVREAARKAGDELKKVAGKLKDKDEDEVSAPEPNRSAPSNAAREVNEAVGKVAAKTQEAAVLFEVKKALSGDKSVDASRIDVDVDDATRTVVLRGSVPDAGQKAAAARIAAARAGDYEVRNELAVIAPN
jgi:hypothetical protein